MSVAAARPLPATTALARRLSDTHHEVLGRRVIAVALGLFTLAGLAALTVRLQLAAPHRGVLGPEAYQELFTEHGVTMLMLFAVPVMEGFALVLVPPLIGADDLAFPRLAAFGVALFAIAGVAVWVALAFGQAPDAGWFSYVPLATPRFQPGLHSAVYAATVILSQTAAIVLALVLLTTILTRRARGMRLSLLPLPVWAILVASGMIVLALPPVVVDATLLTADARLGTAFFSPGDGGDPLLWQHLFWFYGHPLVYIMLLPGLGIVSAVTSTFARRPMVGYPFIVASYLTIGFVSFGVWVHHMFATGHDDSAMGLFSVATFTVAIPSGVHVFAVLATLWHGRPRLEVPMLYVLGFIVIFVAGGITGVTLGSMTADRQYTDTYYVVAHFHYVLLGGVMLPVLAGLHHWWGRLTGWLVPRRPGVVAFALIFTGINVTFLPMFALGIAGMPRRVWTYAPQGGWAALNAISTVGAFVLAAGLAVFAGALLWSIGREPAPTDPWGAGTLDAADRVPPVVTSRYPLWEQREDVLAGRPRVVPARPPTVLPVVAAALVAFGILGVVWDPWLAGTGLLLAGVAIAGWLRTPWGPEPAPLGSGAVVGLIPLTSGLLAVCSTWWVLAAQHHQWPIPPVGDRPVWLAAALSGGAALLGGAAWRTRRPGGRGPLVAAAGAAATIAAVTAVDLWNLPYDQASNASASSLFLVEGGYATVVLCFAAAAASVAVAGSAARAGARVAVARLGVGLAAAWPVVCLTALLGGRLT